MPGWTFQDDGGPLRRTYAAPEGYPHVRLALYPGFLGEPGARLAVDRKDSAEDWWRPCNLPVELAGVLREMLSAWAGRGEGC